MGDERMARSLALAADLRSPGSRYQILGEIDYILGKNADGVASFRKAVARFGTAHHLEGQARGHLVLAIGRKQAAHNLTAAADLLQRTVTKAPKRYTAWILLAAVRTRQGRRAQAVAALDRAARLPDPQGATQLYRGKLANLSGDHEAARRHWRRAAVLVPAYQPLVEKLIEGLR